jgi:hypothetical protein
VQEKISKEKERDEPPGKKNNANMLLAGIQMGVRVVKMKASQRKKLKQ